MENINILQICLFGFATPIIGWNIFWLSEGWFSFKEMYNFRLSWGLSLAVWAYTLSGLLAIVIAINL